MLKALGLKKEKPATEEQIAKYKEQWAARANLKEDVKRLNAILNNLRDAYKDSKGGFAVGRYETLKKMIKNSVEEYKTLSDEKEKKNRKRLMGEPAAANKKAGGSAISRLRQAAEGFASSTEVEDPADKEPDYSALNTKDADAQVNLIRREIVRLKGEWRCLRDRMDKLSQEYQASKSQNPTQRYTLLKNMIKTATASL